MLQLSDFSRADQATAMTMMKAKTTEMTLWLLARRIFQDTSMNGMDVAKVVNVIVNWK